MRKSLSSILLLWAGLIIGVSFIATPAKFLAPNLTMPLALEVGKATFHIFQYIEWGVYGSILILSFLLRPFPFKYYGAVLVLGVILLSQTLWLLPILDTRIDMIVKGTLPQKSSYHTYYIVLEILKLCLTGVSAWFIIKK